MGPLQVNRNRMMYGASIPAVWNDGESGRRGDPPPPSRPVPYEEPPMRGPEPSGPRGGRPSPYGPRNPAPGPGRPGGTPVDPNAPPPPPPPPRNQNPAPRHPSRDGYGYVARGNGGLTSHSASQDGYGADPQAGYGAPYAPAAGDIGMAKLDYDAGGPQSFFPDLTTEDPARMAIQDRTSWYDRGNRIDADFQNEITNRNNLEGRYRSQVDDAYGDLYRNPGYTQEEQNDIIRGSELAGLPATQQDVDSWQLTDGERTSISGNPQSQYGWYNPAQTEGIANETSGRVQGNLNDWGNNGRGAYSGMSVNSRNAISNAALGPARDYMDQQDRALQGGASGIRGAYNNPALGLSGDYTARQDGALRNGAGAVRGFTNDPRLGLSSEYSQNMQFGPQQQMEMEQAAANTIGNSTRALRDKVEMAANASGYNSPMALASGYQQLQQQGDSNMADAALNARVAAKRMGLDVTQQREDTRLGADQYRAGLGSQSELALQRNELGALGEREGMRLDAEGRRAGMAIQGEQALMGAGLNAAGERENFRSGAERDRMGANVQNEQYLGGRLMDFEDRHGQASINANLNTGQMRQDANQFNQATGIDIARNVDNTASDRAGWLAGNRQGIAQAGQRARFDQGFRVNDAMSNRYAGAADARRGDRQEYRTWGTGQTNQQAQLGQNARTGRTGAFGTQGGAANNATGNAAQYRTGNPSFGRTLGQSFSRSLGSSLGSPSSYGG